MAGQLVPMAACIVWALRLDWLRFSLWLPYLSALNMLRIPRVNLDFPAYKMG